MTQSQAARKPATYWNIVLHSVISFAGQSLMQVVDLLFCRNLGANGLATVGTATSLVAWFIILGIGLVSSLEFLIPNALGKGEHRKANEFFYAGSAVCLVTSIASALCLIGLSHLAPRFGMEPLIVKPVQEFCLIVCSSYLPVYLTPLLRVELQARGFPHDTTWAFIFGNLVNVLLNWSLVLGHLGFSPLGTTGAAYANLISRYLILFYLLYRLIRVRSRAGLGLKLKEVPWIKRGQEIFKLGYPSTLHMLFEIGAFIFVGTLASRLKPSQNAAHSIALSLATFAFMIPAGLSSAAAQTMGRALGEQGMTSASTLGYRTIKVGLAYALIGSFVFLFARSVLVAAYTADPETIEVGSKLLLIAAIFQFGDALQVILSGCLRGLGQTKIQALVNGVGHWFIGVPIGLVLAFYFDLGIAGLWIGLCTGLFTVAAALFYFFRRAVQKAAVLQN